MPNTVRLHRVFKTTTEKLYRAFTTPAALAKWIPPNGFTCTVHQMDAKPGGAYKMSFTNFSTGNGHSFGGKYMELVPGEIQVSVMLKKVLMGTEINIVQEGLPDVIPVEACYLGWQESLNNLAALVEPEIPD